MTTCKPKYVPTKCTDCADDFQTDFFATVIVKCESLKIKHKNAFMTMQTVEK